MTKLPSEAFLPTGALDWDPPMTSLKPSTTASSSVSASIAHQQNNGAAPSYALSKFLAGTSSHLPSASPGSRISRSQAYASRGPYNYNLSHSHADAFAASPGTTRTARQHSSSALLSPDTSLPRRASSQSPSTRVPAPPVSYSSQQSASNHRTVASGLGAGSSLLRSVSADAAASQQTSVHLVQRLAQQNALIREAWEAERAYLEANRRRAEEVYQEEREIMEDVREGWENDRVAMATEIQTLKERIQRLEGENATLLAVASQSVQLSGLVSPKPGQPPGSDDTPTQLALGPAVVSSPSSSAAAASRLPHQPILSPPIMGMSQADASILPPGLDGASRRPHHASPGGSRMSPTGQPETSPFIPLEPRTQPRNSSPHDFLSSSSDDLTIPTPVIDVQEIDPKLEGIPIKATAVQKPTFAEATDKPSPATSPPATAEARPNDSSRPMPVKRGSSKDHTLQVLAAEESRRLTMHAGHTPNHSLSLFPTISATENNNTNGPSEGTTPTAGGPSAPGDRLKAPGQGSDPEDEPEPKHPSITDPNAPLPLGAETEPEPHLEPVDDVPLKGPLMVKNIPAQDELFWAQVNKKLEPISQGQNALPTVVRACLDDPQEAGPSHLAAAPPQAVPVAPVGGDASHDDRSETLAADARTTQGSKQAEPDVPLKLKSTTNFGAPFGMA